MNASSESAEETIARFRAQLRTVVLATVSAEGEPESSVAAAVLGDAGSLAIYVSGLAAHTRNLRANPRASALLAEDESAATNALARRRLTLACAAAPIARDGAEFAPLVAQFRARFGGTIDLLAAMPDFQLVRLTPHRARLVVGFGQAFELDPRDWSVKSHVTN
jgi:putative heme iron utilization protein